MASRVRHEAIVSPLAATRSLDPVLHAPGKLDRWLAADVDGPGVVVGERQLSSGVAPSSHASAVFQSTSSSSGRGTR